MPCDEIERGCADEEAGRRESPVDGYELNEAPPLRATLQLSARGTRLHPAFLDLSLAVPLRWSARCVPSPIVRFAWSAGAFLLNSMHRFLLRPWNLPSGICMPPSVIYCNFAL